MVAVLSKWAYCISSASVSSDLKALYKSVIIIIIIIIIIITQSISYALTVASNLFQ